MFWRLLADTVVVLHGLWVLAVVLGPFWAWVNPFFRAIHLGMLWVTMGVLLAGFYCPLTVIETSLRARYDPSRGYAEGFVADFVNRFTRWNIDGADVNKAIIAWAVLWTAIYVFLWVKERFKAG